MCEKPKQPMLTKQRKNQWGGGKKESNINQRQSVTVLYFLRGLQETHLNLEA